MFSCEEVVLHTDHEGIPFVDSVDERNHDAMDGQSQGGGHENFDDEQKKGAMARQGMLDTRTLACNQGEVCRQREERVHWLGES